MDEIKNIINNSIIITAINPMGKAHSEAFNAKANAKLEKDLIKLGLSFIKVNGTYGGNPEEAFAVVTDNVYLLSFLGKKYEQESILVVGRGLVYMDGNEVAQTGIEWHSEKPADFFTEIRGNYFTAKLDWDSIPMAEYSEVVGVF